MPIVSVEGGLRNAYQIHVNLVETLGKVQLRELGSMFQVI